MKKRDISTLIIFIILVLIIVAHQVDLRWLAFKNIKGFSKVTNKELSNFLNKTEGLKSRKIAVFDVDGTIMSQKPYYLSDEALYGYANIHPYYRKNLIAKISKESSESTNYLTNSVLYYAGMLPGQVEAIGAKTFVDKYSNKLYAPMLKLIAELKDQSFEIWIVTSSPELLYQGFLAKSLDIPVTHIIGAKTVIKDGVVSDKIIEPIPTGEGKVSVINTFIKAKPLFVAGNSISDLPMLKDSAQIALVVNPNDTEKLSALGGLTFAAYAKEHGWLVANFAKSNHINKKYAAANYENTRK